MEDLGERVAALEAYRTTDARFADGIRTDMRELGDELRQQRKEMGEHIGLLHAQVQAVGSKIDKYAQARHANDRAIRAAEREESVNRAAWKRLFALLGFGIAFVCYGVWEFVRSKFGG